MEKKRIKISGSMRKKNVKEAGEALTKNFKDFTELFNSFYENREFENEGVKSAQVCLDSLVFSSWLQETKGLEYGNEKKYKKFLNVKAFQECLDFEGNKTTPKIYFEKVTTEAETYINSFNKKYVASEDKERLLQNEIERYEKLLFPEKMQLPLIDKEKPIKGLPYCSREISEIRNYYQKNIEEAKRNYYDDYHNLRLEALVKYYTHLKGIRDAIQSPLFEESNMLMNGLFKVLAIDQFKSYERSMMETGIYLDSIGTWITSVEDLAAFIWALKDKKYFIANNPTKILTKERLFFEKRYRFQKQLEQKTKPVFKNKLKTKVKSFLIPNLF